MAQQADDEGAALLENGKQTERLGRLRAIRQSKGFLLVAMCLSTLTDNLIYGIVVPIFPTSLSERAHVPEQDLQFWIWIAVATFGVAQVLCIPISAMIARRAKHYAPVVCLSLGALALATLLFIFAANPWLIIAARFAQGGSNAIVNVVGLAALVNRFGTDNYGYAFGYIGTFTAIGCVAGPSFGGVVHDLVSYEAVFIIMAVVIAFNLVIVLLVEEPSDATILSESASYGTVQDSSYASSTESGTTSAPSPTTSLRRPQKSGRRKVRIALAVFGTWLSVIMPAFYDTVLPLYIQRLFNWDPLHSGLVFLLLIPGGLCSPLFGSLADRIGTKPLLVSVCFYGAAISAAMCLIQSNELHQIVLLCVIATLFGFCEPTIFTLAGSELTALIEADVTDKRSIKDKILVSCVLTNYGIATGMLLGPVLAGNFQILLGWTGMNLVLSSIMALGGLLFAIWL